MKKEEFLDLIQNKLSNVVVRETTQYTALDVNGKMFLEVHFLSNKIKIQMNSKYLNETDLLILSKVPASHNWSMDSIYYINNNEDFNKVFPIISKVYDASSANYWMIVAGKGGSLWDTFKSENIVSIDFSSDLTDILEYDAPKSLNQGKNQNKYIWQYAHDINIGDYIIATSGFNNIFGIGKCSKTYYYDDTKQNNKHCIGVEWIKKDGGWTFKNKKGARQTVNLDKSYERINLYHSILNDNYSRLSGKKETSQETIMYSEILKNSHNLILRGAPGTGKTYLAKQIARELTDGNEEQIGFVQFHPSYDYTDFVEGLRPVKDDSGDIKFEIKPGIFKTFCEKAKIASQTGGQDNFEEAWKAFFEAVSEVGEDDSYVISSLRGKSMHLRAYERGEMTGVTEKDTSSNFYNKAQCYNLYKGKPGVPQGGFDNYRRAILNHLKEKFGLKDFVPPTETISDKKFVFIIDEINRGEISKIFGELFYSIDPGYRGEDGAVSTQYANMHQEEEKFYIPENVYIIGTMNDIDRSVDSFDFAMRRRFRFVEIKAADSMVMWEKDENFDNDQIPEARARLTNLNQAIENTPELDSNYHIGPSYFLKLPELDYDYEILWQDYLQPLLEEYLRGTFEEAERLRELKAAYDRLEEETHVDEG